MGSETDMEIAGRAWKRPVYKLLAWDRPGDRCHGRLGPCIKLAELAIPLPDRPFTFLYCLDCWKWMADHLISQGYTVEVAKDASDVLATRTQQPVRLHVRNQRAPDYPRTVAGHLIRCDPRPATRRAGSAQEGGDRADA
jgi:hypothetical protein